MNSNKISEVTWNATRNKTFDAISNTLHYTAYDDSSVTFAIVFTATWFVTHDTTMAATSEFLNEL